MDATWELIDRGGVAIPFGILNDAHQAVDAVIVRDSPAPSQLPLPSSTASPAIRQVSDIPDCDDLKLFFLDEDVPVLTAIQRRERRRQTEWSYEPVASWGGRPEQARCFIVILTQRTSRGVKFVLKNGTSLRTSIQRQGGERVSPKIVRWALWKVQHDLKHRGLSYRRPRILRIQHLVLRFAEVLAFQNLVHPGTPSHDLRQEALAALFAVLDALEKEGETKRN